MFKIVNIFVYSSKKPFTLAIALDNGFILERQNIRRDKALISIAVDCCVNSIKLIAKFQNQTQIKRIFLSPCECQNILAGYSFYTPQNTPQLFTLYDRNYNFPIPTATLNFLQR